jgi:hypothetical protein
MAIKNLFAANTAAASPLDASNGNESSPSVSDFVTVQSFANFAVMTGAITAAWRALQIIIPRASALWVPYLFAFLWAIISFLMSAKDLKGKGFGNGCQAIFIALINSLVLAGAVVGTNVVTS